MSALIGRHDARGGSGRPFSREWRRRSFDQAERAVAARLDAAEPLWSVGYSLWARDFYAIAQWNAPRALIVRAPVVEGLRWLMREAEQAVLREVHGVPAPRLPDGGGG